MTKATLIAWATREIEKRRPVNAVFVLAGAKSGVQLSSGLKDVRRLQAWVKNVEEKFQTIRPPPRIEVSLAFEDTEMPGSFFWSQRWFDEARDLHEHAHALRHLALAATSTAHKLDRAIRARATEFHILETPWVAMAASANWVFSIKTELAGARTQPLDRQEIALLEIACGLRNEKPTIDHLNYISSRKLIVQRATALLQRFAVGAAPFADLRTGRTGQRGPTDT